MVVRDGIEGADAGENRLAAAAETAEIVHDHGAGDDDPVSFPHPAVDAYGGAAGGGAKGDQVGLIRGVMGMGLASESLVDRGTEDLGLLVRGRRAVGTGGEDEAKVLVGHPGQAEPIEQAREDLVDAGLPEGIGDDNGDGFAGADLLKDGLLEADRAPKDLIDGLVQVLRGVGIAHIEHPRAMCPGDLRFTDPRTVWQVKLS